MSTVSQREDIKSLIERVAGIRVVGEATVDGFKEYHSNCPWCPGSVDSFITCPDTGRFSHAIRSKGCGKKGDAIDFLEWYCGMERSQAIEELDLKHVSFYSAKPVPKRKRYDPPSKQWQGTGWNFVERAAYYLWSDASSAREALAYLRGRGLSDETIRKKKFGYCPLTKNGRWFGEDPKEGAFEHWGLKPEDIKNEEIRNRGTILIPPGIVLPWSQDETLWKIAIKRLDEPNPDRRYRDVAGSAHGLYNVDTIQPGKPCMIVEGEIDAASVEQEAGDLVSVVATGSADKGRNPYFIPALSLPSCLIQSFDNDEPDEQGKRAGDAGAVYWLHLYDHCFRYRPVGAKDPSDILRAYGRVSIRNWVQAALGRWELLKQPKGDIRVVQEEFERLCVGERVQTTQGPGSIWNQTGLHEQIQEGKILVLLDKGVLGLFLPRQLEPLARVS